MARYTDVDELLKYIPSEEMMSRFAVAYAPIADVAPVKHGTWIENLSYEYNGDKVYDLICTNCGRSFKAEDWVRKDYHYCPYCGAKMEDGDNGL